MTITEALRAISLYPINPLTAENIAGACELSGDQEVTAAVRASSAFKRANAKVYEYLAEAPAVQQSGAVYSFTDAEREQFRAKARAIYSALGDDEDDSATGITCGYIGEDL